MGVRLLRHDYLDILTEPGTGEWCQTSATAGNRRSSTAWNSSDLRNAIVTEETGSLFKIMPVQSGSSSTQTQYSYVYDALNRLTQVKDFASNGVIESYTYDVYGNRTGKTNAQSTLVYIYDDANQLKETRQGSATGPRAGAFIYDLNGNLTKKCEGGTVNLSSTDCTGSVITELSYDILNRVTQVSKTGIATQSYVYDDQGRRIRKTVGTTVTNYLYSGPDIVAEYGSNWNQVNAIYTHGPGMDDPIIRTSASGLQYYHQDGLGSVVGVTNQNGGIEATASYDAWGKTIASTGTISQYGYTGREPDETGLIYYRARYYDSSIGRFTQRDPIGMSGGMNLYAYVNNNPINFNDPMGLALQTPTNSVGFSSSGQVTVNDISYVASSNSGINSGCQCLAGQQYAAANTGVMSDADAGNVSSSPSLQGMGIFAGQQLGDAGAIRDNYSPTVRGLGAFDDDVRKGLKQAFREEMPVTTRAVLEELRPGTGARAGSIGHANQPSGFWMRFPHQPSHRFRSKAATQSGAIRPPFRGKPATVVVWG